MARVGLRQVFGLLPGFLLLLYLTLICGITEFEEIDEGSGETYQVVDPVHKSTTVKPTKPPLPRHKKDGEDVVQTFLSTVEQYARDKENCTPGTEHNLGEGVVQQQYGVRRFKRQALLAVNRANFLTQIWRSAGPGVTTSDYFFYIQVRSMVEGDPDVFAAGNCYAPGMYNDKYDLFCPFSHRIAEEDGVIVVKDLSVSYKYGNHSEWFYQAQVNANRKLQNYNRTMGKYPFYLVLTDATTCITIPLFAL